MAGEIIRIGDSTSHGGKVLEGSLTDICMGKPIAFIGHKVQCPMCRGAYPIIEGAPVTTIFGKGVALAGMKTSCGAVLIASQFTDIVEMGGKSGGSSAASHPGDAAADDSDGATAGAGTGSGQETPPETSSSDTAPPTPTLVAGPGGVHQVAANPTTSSAQVTGTSAAAGGSSAVAPAAAIASPRQNLASPRAVVSRPSPLLEQLQAAAVQDAQAATLETAAKSGAPFCEVCTAGAAKAPASKVVA
ncbi:MAG: PAAR domain-containing protein [Massilia sp.]